MVQHEIGIDLLAALESEYWSQTGSGKIPIFLSTVTRDENGEITAEKVSYAPLRFVQGLLWDNNPLNAAYQALKKRIVHKQFAGDESNSQQTD